MGIIFDFHGWRGFSWDRDLFHWRVTAGFMTTMLCKFCVIDRMAMLGASLKEIKAKLQRTEEGR
jgi:hypothetical protein